MKRSAPLKRSPLSRRSRLRPRSEKARRTDPARARCKAAVRERSGGMCEARFSPFCRGWGNCTHELLKRSQGGSVTDPDNCRWVCDVCNSAIEDEPRRAHAAGLVIRRSDLTS